MMLCKLSLKNIKKSIKDYAIYFFTLVLGVSIFYVFNALGSQTIMLDVSSSTKELIELMIEVLSYVSVFVSFVLGFLIIYASRFLIKRRNKEFGIYLTLGFSKRKISMILFFETLFIGLVSLGVGLLLGVMLSQLMSLLVANMFEADLTKFTFVFSKSACLKTVIYFGIMYLVVMIFNTISVSKCKLIDLLNDHKKIDEIKLKNPIVATIIFILASIVLGYAYYMVTIDFDNLRNIDILVPISMGCISTFFIFFSISGLIIKITKSMKSYYYKGLNSFTLKQFSKKINTTVFATTIICLMLFITICLLSACLSLKNSMNNEVKDLTLADFYYDIPLNYDKEYDYYKLYGYNDLQIKNTKYSVLEMFDILGFDLKKYSNDYIEFNTYQTDELNMCTSLGSICMETRIKYPYLSYEARERIISLSDYNKVARLYKTKEYSLNEDEYLIVADFESMISIRNQALKNKTEIKVFDRTLKPKYDECMDGFLEMSTNHVNTGIIVVPDSVLVNQEPARNHLIGNYNTKNRNTIRKIEEDINKLDNSPLRKEYLFPNGTTKLAIQESVVGLSAMLTFIGLYLGIIFLISSAAILGLKELSESSDNKQVYKMLRKIGVDERDINKALFKQILTFFMLPLILAIIHSVFGLIFSLKILETFGNKDLLSSIIMTCIFIIIIYGGYFLITYISSKNIIKEN